MAFPIHVPRINNNDDVVRVVVVSVVAGTFVRAGETLLEVESDKATVAVEAEQDGHVLAILAAEGDMVAVGTVAMWLGAHADDVVPEQDRPAAPSAVGASRPVTAKARLLLARYGLSADGIPGAGERLTADEVEVYAAARGLTAAAASVPPAAPNPPVLPAAAAIRPASPVQRGMIAAVRWQRDHAAATYLEIPYDPAPWEAYAAEFAKASRLLFSPLLALMAHRLAVLAREMPAANGTVLERPDGPAEVRYEAVNLGFTVQAGDILYLVVLPGAEALDEAGCVARLGELQRRAMAHRVEPRDLQGATVGFSSMARWGVSRHVPVLAPWTALMVSHTVSGAGPARAGVLGATYDHRVLTGFDAARLLRALAVPPRQQTP
jgi:pyruvate/2-oxoglutarate dehydrogenase complex dihydrolipoamide acyltransferase (E2) component